MEESDYEKDYEPYRHGYHKRLVGYTYGGLRRAVCPLGDGQDILHPVRDNLP
jgi:hypothetical protein